MTDVELLLAEISQAEKHIGKGERLIVRQKARIRELRDGGHDSSGAEVLLRQFEAAQAIHIFGLEQLLEERDRWGA